MLRLTPQFGSPDEAIFCQRRFARRHWTIARSGYWASIVMMPSFIYVAYLWVPSPMFETLIAGFLGSWICCFSAAMLHYLYKLQLSFLVAIGWVCFQTSLSVTLFLTAGQPLVADINLFISIALCAGILLFILYLPLQGRQALWVIAAETAVAILLIPPIKIPAMWVFVVSAIAATGVWYRIFIEAESWDLARAEYRSLQATVPTIILKYAALSGKNVESLLVPQRSFCVCLSGDWRGYQRVASDLESSVLTDSLSHFYAEVRALIEYHVPEGNYVFDWIADELFLAVFSPNVADANRMTNQVVQLAHALILKRPQIATAYGHPQALDLGVSAGFAHVGFIGRDGFRKATAIGETPGRARRLQTGGKLLRNKLGEQDRIIFGREVLLLMSTPLDVQNLQLGEEELVRDILERDLFFVEPRVHVDADVA